jgi:hypothetical protein
MTDKSKPCRMPFSGMLPRVALVRTDVSEKHSASWRWRREIPPKRRFLQDPHGVTSQKTAFFIVTAVKTSNLPSPKPVLLSAL